MCVESKPAKIARGLRNKMKGLFRELEDETEDKLTVKNPKRKAGLRKEKHIGKRRKGKEKERPIISRKKGPLARTRSMRACNETQRGRKGRGSEQRKSQSREREIRRKKEGTGRGEKKIAVGREIRKQKMFGYVWTLCYLIQRNCGIVARNNGSQTEVQRTKESLHTQTTERTKGSKSIATKRTISFIDVSDSCSRLPPLCPPKCLTYPL